MAITFNWPTPETSNLWWEFVSEFEPSSESVWKPSVAELPVQWMDSYEPQYGQLVKLSNAREEATLVLASNGETIGELRSRLKLQEKGIYLAKVHQDTSLLDVTYWGTGTKPFAVEQQ